MTVFDASQLVAEMVVVARAKIEDRLPGCEDILAAELGRLVNTVNYIKERLDSGLMNRDQAFLYLDMQKNAARLVLYSCEGISVLAVEAAINSALEAVSERVNQALGFQLI